MVMTDEEYRTIVSHNRDHYGLGFFKFADEDHGPSNLRFGEVLWSLYQPASVVDFGCGTAGALSALRQHGVEVLGVDGYSACLPLIERRDPDLVSHIMIHDLTTPWVNPRNQGFDLAVSIEFLEHVGPEAADTAVASIASAAPLAIVTAAPPSGGNALHLNEQPFSYWAEKFAANGMLYNKESTAEFTGIMRELARKYDDSKGRLGCLIPCWFFSSYIGVFKHAR